MKKLVFLLCLVLAFSSTSVSEAFAIGFDKDPGSNMDLKSQLIAKEAADTYNLINADMPELSLTILVDNSTERVVESVQDGVKSIATFNKLTNVLTTKVEGQEEIVLDLNSLAKEQLKIESENEMNALAGKLEENTWTNFEYTINYGTPNKWQMRRPNGNSLTKILYYNVNETSKNKANLTGFKNSVNSLNDYERRFIGAVSGVGILTVASLVVGAINGAAGVGVGLVALGVAGAAYNYGISMERAAKNAYHYYWQV